MSVGIHRLSLLLGILGACFGTLGAVVEGGAVYSRSQAWNSYDDKQAAYEALVAKQTEVIAAWEAASEHVTKDGDHKFVKAESSEIFSAAVKAGRGQWYKLILRAKKGPITPGQFLETTWEPRHEYFQHSEVGEQAGDELSRLPGLPEPPPSPSYSSSPGALSYVGVIAWPVVGFLLPWGTVRVVGWVIMGFVLDLRGKRPADENDD